MKKVVLCVAVAGLASAAMGQEFALDLSAPTDVSVGGTFVIEVTGDSDFGTHMLGGGFSLMTNSSLIENITWNPASWSAFNEDNEGYLGNGNYGQIVFGQLLLPIPGFDTPAAGSELGSAIGTFEIELVDVGFGVIDFTLVASSPFTLEAVDTANGLATAQDVDGSLTLNGLSVIYYPTPSATALLAFGGLVAGRRRRV